MIVLAEVRKEILLITKLFAYSRRRGSVKGEKDKIDILSLLIFNEIDYQDLSLYTKEFNLTSLKDLLKEILFESKEIKELNLNQFRWSKTKKEILKNFRD